MYHFVCWRTAVDHGRVTDCKQWKTNAIDWIINENILAEINGKKTQTTVTARGQVYCISKMCKSKISANQTRENLELHELWLRMLWLYGKSCLKVRKMWLSDKRFTLESKGNSNICCARACVWVADNELYINGIIYCISECIQLHRTDTCVLKFRFSNNKIKLKIL